MARQFLSTLLQHPISCGKILVDIWHKCRIVLVGLFLIFAASEEVLLVFGLVLVLYLSFQLSNLSAKLLKFSPTDISSAAAIANSAAAVGLAHLLELVPLLVRKLAIFPGPEITFPYGTSFQLLLGWRFSTWLASESPFPALFTSLIPQDILIAITCAHCGHLTGIGNLVMPNVVSKQGNTPGEVMVQLSVS